MMKLFMSINMMFILISSLICLMINLIPSHNKNIHPIMMNLILLILSIFTSMNLSIYMNSHWFSYIMFLILIGGMMILFLYFTSFISNMKMSMKWMYLYSIPIKFMILTIMIMFMMIYMNINFNWYNSYNEISSNLNIMKFSMINNNNLYMYMYMYNKNFMTLMSMMYLLMTMTLIVKICINKKFSIRKIN